MSNSAGYRSRGTGLSLRRRSAGAPRRGTSRRREGELTGGGPRGNERLTVLTVLTPLVLLAALGITIVRIGQLLWLHLFLGLVLGPRRSSC